jgi:hypothetical protein
MKPIQRIFWCVLMLWGGRADGATTNRFDDVMNGILSHYLKIHQQLTADSIEGVSLDAEAIATAATQPDFKPPADLRDSVKNLGKVAKMLAGAPDLETARERFKALSRSLITWVLKSKPPDLQVMYCDEVDSTWIQRKGDLLNPYTGLAHVLCGEPVESSQK